MKEHGISILNGPVDVSMDFQSPDNSYFIASALQSFNAKTKSGILECKRHARKVRMCINQMSMPFEETAPWEFPQEYEADLHLPISIGFVNSRVIRLNIAARESVSPDQPSMMLVKRPEEDDSWTVSNRDSSCTYESEFGKVEVQYDPFNICIFDKNGNLLTKTLNIKDTKNLENGEPTPFSVVRRNSDMKRRIAASFSLSPDEKLFGCGESFTRLNKRGQKLVLYTTDAMGVQSREMYKPIPFFMSSNGYGMFVHTSAPLTFDFGNSYDAANMIFVGDTQLELYIFIGNPKEILSEYTNLTGRSSMPPLWSFGLWMSRISYFSEKEVKEVATKLRNNRIPCDVLHLDTGWFETEWRCNYQFSESRFENPKNMIKELKENGFHISLWQLPYFTPTNEMYREAIQKGYVVLDGDGELPTEDAIIDFSNPEAVKWYQGLLKTLLELGVEVIKADFGEAAPLKGCYYSGRTGFYEHNLYPLRYNKAVSEITKEVTGNAIIWGRSAWTGSQRYPLHWGGDAENTDCGMAATLRAGLSLGLCGFSFWSHDIGGFVQKSPEELYLRWLAFGMMTSHSRCHGAPPKEPWMYGEEFMDSFREIVEMKYRLMPYIMEQAKICAEKGFPMMRTLFFEFPEDLTSWMIEDEYLFGSDLLVAPLLQENKKERAVYLPFGLWTDYQTGKKYEGEKWHKISQGKVPIVILVRENAVIPQVEVAQCTSMIDWNTVKLQKF